MTHGKLKRYFYGRQDRQVLLGPEPFGLRGTVHAVIAISRASPLLSPFAVRTNTSGIGLPLLVAEARSGRETDNVP